MKRLLLLTILIFSFLYADTIVFQSETKKGEYLGILDSKVYLKEGKKINSFNCKDVSAIYDYNTKPIAFDCSDNTYLTNNSNGLLSGYFIGIGGFILLYSNMKECNDCNENKLESHVEGVKDLLNIGYIFILVGGILLGNGL